MFRTDERRMTLPRQIAMQNLNQIKIIRPEDRSLTRRKSHPMMGQVSFLWSSWCGFGYHQWKGRQTDQVDCRDIVSLVLLHRVLLGYMSEPVYTARWSLTSHPYIGLIIHVLLANDSIELSYMCKSYTYNVREGDVGSTYSNAMRRQRD